jgi:hypothetical protein
VAVPAAAGRDSQRSHGDGGGMDARRPAGGGSMRRRRTRMAHMIQARRVHLLATNRKTLTTKKNIMNLLVRHGTQ